MTEFSNEFKNLSKKFEDGRYVEVILFGVQFIGWFCEEVLKQDQSNLQESSQEEYELRADTFGIKNTKVFNVLDEEIRSARKKAGDSSRQWQTNFLEVFDLCLEGVFVKIKYTKDFKQIVTPLIPISGDIMNKFKNIRETRNKIAHQYYMGASKNYRSNKYLRLSAQNTITLCALYEGFEEAGLLNEE